MRIEMYVGFHGVGESGTWRTLYIEIPDSTPKDEIPEVAKRQIEQELSGPQYANQMIAFYGVYHIEVPSSEGRDE